MLTADKVQYLLDIEEIKKLKYLYMEYCDRGYLAEKIAALFTEDAVWEGGPLGRHVGRAAIRDCFAGAGGIISFAEHFVTNPIIDVDGDVATGRWVLWQPAILKHKEGTGAAWVIGTYKDEYARDRGAWKFKNVLFEPKAISPYEKGFAKQMMVDLAVG